MRCTIRFMPALSALALLGACAEQSPTGTSSTSRPTLDVSGGPSAQAWNGRIRIGVVPSASSVQIGGSGAFEVREKGTNRLLVSGSNQDATVTLASVLVSTSSRRLQVVCTRSVADRDARLAAGQAKGYPTHTEFVPAPSSCWRVYIGERPLPANGALETAYKNNVIADGLATSGAFWRTVTVSTGTTQYKTVLGSATATSPNSPVLTPLSGLARINGRLYRGTAEVRLNSGATLAGINELPLEEYLYGVVPLELGPIQYPELEALKAQSVAARTYAISNIGKRAVDGYDLLPTMSDQVYGGFQSEHPRSSEAVDATRGIVATYGGRPIAALYSSTSGGFTANNEEAFQASPVPYLRGLVDAERGRAPEHVPSIEVFQNHANARSLRASREGDFESDWARFHRWHFEWTNAEISDVISDFAGKPVGQVLAINVLERGPSGRVLTIEYVTEQGTFTDFRDRIRSSLKFFNASGKKANLLSTLFYIEPVHDRRTKELAGFKAYGGGFGHGVGMAQTGAVGMAEKGHTYDEILKHYYRGIELTSISP